MLRPGRHSEQLWIPGIAQNGFLVEGFGVGNSIGVPGFAQDDVLDEGFGAFGIISGIQM